MALIPENREDVKRLLLEHIGRLAAEYRQRPDTETHQALMEAVRTFYECGG